MPEAVSIIEISNITPTAAIFDRMLMVSSSGKEIVGGFPQTLVIQTEVVKRNREFQLLGQGENCHVNFLPHSTQSLPVGHLGPLSCCYLHTHAWGRFSLFI